MATIQGSFYNFTATDYYSETGKIGSYADHEPGLWRAVITQALMDAGSQSNKTEAKRSRRDALTWLLNDSQGFEAVCDNAGFDPGYIRRRVREALARNCEWRLPNGQGWRTVARRARDEQQTALSNLTH